MTCAATAVGRTPTDVDFRVVSRPGPGGADGEPMTRTYNGCRMKCGDVDAEPTATNGRRMATSGRPVLCGTELNRILGKA